MEYKGKTYSANIAKKEKESDDNSDDSDTKEYTYTVKSGTKKLDADDFLTAYEAIGNLTYSTEIQKKISSDKVVASLKIKTDDETTSVSFLPYDGVNFYRVKVDGVCQFLVDKNKVDSVLKDLTAEMK